MKRSALMLAFVWLFALAGCDSGGANPSAASSAEATAAPSGPEPDRAMLAATKQRKALFTLIFKNYLPIASMARERIPFDADVVRTNAEHIQNLGAMMADVFETDTRGSGVVTESLDAIWEQPEKYAQKISAFQAASVALVGAAATGDEATIKASAGRLGQSCGSCHDDFRVDDD
ncbi:MAG: cytochrome c [Pseudomonadota bacterium]